MMSIEKSTNNASIIKRIEGLDKMTHTAIRKALYSVGKDLAADARDFINLKPKHGLLYRIIRGAGGKKLKRAKDYRASAPGEAPGVITGKLRKSINFSVITPFATTGATQLEFGVDKRGRYGGAEYGKYLEYADLIAMSGQGSKHIKPRPFISASYKKNKGRIYTVLTEAMNGAFKK